MRRFPWVKSAQQLPWHRSASQVMCKAITASSSMLSKPPHLLAPGFIRQRQAQIPDAHRQILITFRLLDHRGVHGTMKASLTSSGAGRTRQPGVGPVSTTALAPPPPSGRAGLAPRCQHSMMPSGLPTSMRFAICPPRARQLLVTPSAHPSADVRCVLRPTADGCHKDGQ